MTDSDPSNGTETRQNLQAANTFATVGALAAEKGRLGEARRQFERAIIATPKHFEALSDLVLIAMSKRKVGEALK